MSTSVQHTAVERFLNCYRIRFILGLLKNSKIKLGLFGGSLTKFLITFSQGLEINPVRIRPSKSHLGRSGGIKTICGL